MSSISVAKVTRIAESLPLGKTCPTAGVVLEDARRFVDTAAGPEGAIVPIPSFEARPGPASPKAAPKRGGSTKTESRSKRVTHDRLTENENLARLLHDEEQRNQEMRDEMM